MHSKIFSPHCSELTPALHQLGGSTGPIYGRPCPRISIRFRSAHLYRSYPTSELKAWEDRIFSQLSSQSQWAKMYVILRLSLNISMFRFLLSKPSVTSLPQPG